MIEKLNIIIISITVFILSSLVLSPSSFGETWYVKDQLKLTIRAGEGTQYRILGLLSSGDSVEVIEIKDGWAEIRLGEDKKGWVLARYLSKSIPKTAKYNEMEIKIKDQSVKLKQLKTERDELKKENKDLKEQLLKEKEKTEQLSRNYEELKEGSVSYISVKESRDQLLCELKEKKDINRKLIIENQILRRSQKVYLLIGGAGVLLIGWLIGSAVERRRVKNSSRLKYRF
ncbi:MAG: TIGR04211 family SH3 domain-containing protein [Thermodesulfobacteriota bacterium]|nr:TIGR04211 family SH3 domain-containing protein [Thermodesulfobacteriota bacterium]